VLGLGAVLKVTVATLCRGELVVGRHLGDLDNARAEQAFRQEVERMLRFGQIEPEAVAVDLHPDMASRELVERALPGVPLRSVQHHHAHLAAVMVEHRLGPEAEAVGIVLDGFGHGPDGAIWGGEVLRGGYHGFERLGHLRYVPQPGGDRAALEPGRMATSLLRDAGLGRPGMPGYDERVAAICAVRAVSPLTSSAGRLFDGVAALLGVAPAEQDYEGEAAARLETLADASCPDGYPLPVEDGVLDTRALTEALVRDTAAPPVRAARFHNGLADGLAAVALGTGVETVVLGGGSMVNRLLLERLATGLEQAGRRVLWAQRLPPGDGGLSAGQVACVACQLGE
jgi:hydrogenase maturation protein HypF